MRQLKKPASVNKKRYLLKNFGADRESEKIFPVRTEADRVSHSETRKNYGRRNETFKKSQFKCEKP